MLYSILLLQRQIMYDIRNGIIRRYKIYLFFMILLSLMLAFFYKNVGLSISMKPGLRDYLIYIFKGKEAIINITNKDIFDIPIVWIFVHIYTLFVIGTYPKTEFTERGYQFLIRAGNKWCWWLGKCVYIILSAFIYHFCIIFVGIIFTTLSGGSYTKINEELCVRILGSDSVNFLNEKFYLCTIIMPVLLFMVLGFVSMLISLLQSSVLAIIVSISYISVSAYLCNNLLLGNYTMLLRAHKMSFDIGVVLSVISILFSSTFGYAYFKSLDIYDNNLPES